MTMKLIRCKSCGSPIALRSNGLNDAFSPEADQLRRTYRGKLKPCTTKSSDKQICADCYKKEKRMKCNYCGEEIAQSASALDNICKPCLWKEKKRGSGE